MIPKKKLHGKLQYEYSSPQQRWHPEGDEAESRDLGISLGVNVNLVRRSLGFARDDTLLGYLYFAKLQFIGSCRNAIVNKAITFS